MKKKKEKKIGLGYYLAHHKLAIFFYMLVMTIASVSTILCVILFANAIELITQEFFQKAIYVFLIILGLYLLRRFCYYMANRIYYKYSSKIMHELNYDLAKQAFKLNSKTYNDHDTGTFMQRIISDPERAVTNLADIFDQMTEVLTGLIIIIYLITLNYWIALILIVVLGLCIVLEFFRIKVRRKNHKVARKANDEVTSLTTEIIRSERDIKSLNLENKLSEISNQTFEKYRNAQYKFNQVDVNFWSARHLIMELLTIGVLILGIVLLDKGLFTLAGFMILYSNSSSLSSFVWNIGSISARITDVKVSTGRMFSLFDEKEFVTEKFGTVSKENVVGKIEFNDVSYSFKEYEEKKFDDKKYHPKEFILVSENKIFDKLSFKIKPNTTVAFVGKSGSGKSTILNLMSKMFECDSGQVLIDGVDIKDFDKPTLRKTISLVNQFPYIFDMTIKENLILAKEDATDEEINDAIKKASLDEFISSLPKGLETKVGESGIKLSGGQKQRLAIARALLRNSSIIIFDESTSSLDNFAQADIKKSIDSLKGKSTIIIVAHRLSTIKNVDKIFFLEDGEIIDSGTFDKLFTKNKKFKEMFLTENI
jgi:ATP-binding cassette subfamily B protein